MDSFQFTVLLAGGALTLIAFGSKIWSWICKGFRWLFFRPHENIRKDMVEKCVEFDGRINELNQWQIRKDTEMVAMNDGVLAILHDRIFQACKYYLKEGEISADELENLGYLYKGYAGLHGNSTCEILYNKVKELRIVD